MTIKLISELEERNESVQIHTSISLDFEWGHKSNQDSNLPLRIHDVSALTE